MKDFDYYLKKGLIVEEVQNDLKAYAFDWDDNIQFLPTTIKLVNQNKKQVKEFSTSDFAIKRTDPKILELLNQGYEWDYGSFRWWSDEEFISDALSSPVGPAWPDFVECINNAYLFAIITARGHNPNAYKKVIYKMIMSNKNGINKDEVVKNIKNFREAMGHKIDFPDKLLITKYVNQCKYYPIMFPKVQELLGTSGGNAANPEKLKILALKHFKQFTNKMHSLLIKKVGHKEISIGFSDDDQRNINAMEKAASEDDNIKDVNLKYTGPK